MEMVVVVVVVVGVILRGLNLYIHIIIMQEQILRREISGKFVLSIPRNFPWWFKTMTMEKKKTENKRNGTMNVLARQGHWHRDVIEMLSFLSSSP
jgi:hypothetical protein